jgi:ribonuclease HI
VSPLTDAQILLAVAEAEAFSQTLQKHPQLSHSQVVDCLRRSARGGSDHQPIPAPHAARTDGATPPARSPGTLERVKIYSDGAARGNPGPAGAGAVIVASDGTPVAHLGRFLGEATNNYAEYHGLLLGLNRARELGVSEVQVYADSQLVIRQLGGQYRVRNEGLRPLFDEALRLLRTFRKFELHHIPREKNTAADEMSNRAIDEKM